VELGGAGAWEMGRVEEMGLGILDIGKLVDWEIGIADSLALTLRFLGPGRGARYAT
jgi:hypothetical protein